MTPSLPAASKPGLDRASFMARVRVALEREREDETGPVPAPPAVDDALVRLASANDDLVATFARQAEAVGIIVHPATSETLPTVLRSRLQTQPAPRVTLGIADPAHAALVSEAVTATGGEVVDWRAAPGLEPHYGCDFGITDVVAALAETGTIVVTSGPEHSRGTFLLPPVHLALLRASDILPDMLDLWPRIRRDHPTAKDMPAVTVLITGPSKTADIEGILIEGVHGPREVHVILIEDL